MNLTMKQWLIVFSSVLSSVLLTSCGGGSTSSSSVDSSGTGGSASSTFAIASGFTSSADTMDLLALIQSGAVSQLPVFGLVRQYSWTLSSNTGYGPSSQTYDMFDSDINVGLSKIYYDDKNKGTRPKDYYLKNIAGLSGTRYRNGSDDAFVIDQFNVFEPYLAYGTLQSLVDGGGNFVYRGIGDYDNTQFGSHAPYLIYGLKTDKNDAPTTSTVTYKASVTMFTGDGSPVMVNGVNAHQNLLSLSCTQGLTLTLDTASGLLTTAAASACQDSNNASDSLTFSLDKVYFVNATLRKDTASATAAKFTAVGHLSTTNVDPNNAPVVTHTGQSTKISGAIFGKGAQTIVIQGSGANGSFFLRGIKQ